MDFGEAIKLLKAGKRVARHGWNGKNMYIYMYFPAKEPITSLIDPYIIMFTAQKRHQPGWLASQADMLAEDWVEVNL